MTLELILRTIFVGAFMVTLAFVVFDWEQSRGMSLDYARTAVVTGIVVLEIFYLFNCRSLLYTTASIGYFSNPWVWVGSFLMLVFQAIFVYVPALGRLFSTEPLQIESWLFIFCSGFILYVLINLEKRIRRTRLVTRPISADTKKI